jgi:hypothetical protein
MRIETEEERQAAQETLEKVMEKLQEALRLSHLVESHMADGPKVGGPGGFADGGRAARSADAPVK